MILRNTNLITIIVFLLLSFIISSENAQGQYEQYYDVLPDISQCETGALKQTEKDKVLALLNKIRDLHGLPHFEYDENFDDEVMGTSLIIVANYKDHGFSLENHKPPQNWHCWTQEGYNGGSSSNLFFSSGNPNSEKSVTSWLIDNGVISLGHRRWILDPFVKKIAFGRVDGIPINGTTTISGMAFYYDSKNEGDISSMKNDFVAYPYGDYPPNFYDLGWSVMSFSVIADKASRLSNRDKVIFSSTLDGQQVNKVYVEIEDESGSVTTYTPDIPGQVGWDYDGYGLPNCLIWQVSNLKEQKVYKVRIFDILVNGSKKNFSYEFAFRDPFISKPGTSVLSQPQDNSVDINPNVRFEWGSSQGADKYILEVADNSGFAQPDIIFRNENITTTSYQISGVLEPMKEYYWRIAGMNDAGTGDWSPVWKFTTTTAPDEPTLAGPVNNSTNVSITPKFTWNEADKAESYQLQISDSDTFSNLLIDEEDIPHTSFTVESEVLGPNTKYFWRVRSISSISGPSAWSDTWAFTTAEAAPGSPELISPEQGKADLSAEVQLEWSVMPGATSYELQISSDNLFNEWDIALDTTGLVANKFKVASGVLELETRYFWHVKSVGLGGSSDWSKRGRFSVGDATPIEDEFIISNANVSVYPNPFAENTSIQVSMNIKDNVRLKIYNQLGIEIDEIINGELFPGDYTINYNSSKLAGGVYYYQLIGLKINISGRLNIIK